MPRLVRRRPLWERITSMLDPMDFLLWLSEELETRDWDSALGTQLGLGFNLLYLVVRANSGSAPAGDDIFGDDSSISWSSMLLFPLSWSLFALSTLNTVYALSRTRKYCLFQADIDVKPSTPSVRRVRVDTPSATATSPMRFIPSLLSSEPAESRVHPEKGRDVWELSVWDPLPVCTRFMCLFSPGHALVYLIFLPLAPLEPRPSVAIFNTLIMQLVLSAQMTLLSWRYTQQAKDNAIIQKEVFHEYDTKFVQPRIHPVVRDIGTQISEDQPPHHREFVQVGTPTTLIRKSFITSSAAGNAQPHNFSPAGRGESPALSSRLSQGIRHSLPPADTSGTTTPVARTPASWIERSEASSAYTPVIQPPSTSLGTSTGLNSAHSTSTTRSSYLPAKSPLKKATSTGNINVDDEISPFHMRERSSYGQGSHAPSSSPAKPSESRRFADINPNSSPHPFANMGKHSAAERFPKRAWRP